MLGAAHLPPLVAAFFLGGPVAAGEATAPIEPAAFTDTRTAHACLVRSDDMLVGTDGGLVIASRGRVRAVHTALGGLPGTRVRALLADGDRVWLGTEGGVALVSIASGADRAPSVQVHSSLRSKPVTDMIRHAGRTFVATWGGGVFEMIGSGASARLAPLPWAYARPRPAQLRTTSLASHGGTLYVGTAGRGVYRIDRGQLIPSAAGLESGLVWSLASRKSRLYVGTVDGLFAVFGDRARRVGDGDIRAIESIGDKLLIAPFGKPIADARTGRRADAFPAAARMALGLATSSAGQCVAGRDGVFERRDGRTWTELETHNGPSANDIAALAVDGDKVYVGGFDGGLSVFDSGNFRRIEHRLIDNKINALAIERRRGHRVLWVATASGLTRVEGNRLTRLGRSDGLPARHVLSVTTLARGGVLVGTTQGAVIVRDGRPPQLLGRKQGLPVGNVWSAVVDATGTIWLGTTKGIYRGTVGGTWSRLSVSSGHLTDDWVTALAVRGRSVFAGTYSGGVVRFDLGRDPTAVPAASKLGGGFVNPGGITVAGGRLLVSTMEGLLTGDGSGPWNKSRPAPGKDTTATAIVGNALWVASRRGLSRIAAPKP